MIWGVSAAVLVLIVSAALAERWVRQARAAARHKIETPRGIVEEGYVRIGGIDQWIGIRGEDRDNPVLLVLHGGPGCSYSIFSPLLREWERHFTIVQWDQRGAGKTFARNGKRGSGGLSFEQLIRDGAEVAEYARARLGQQRIFLLASSLGSVFGTRLARRRPDLFHAYIGTDQNTGMRRGSEEGHQELMDRLHCHGMSKGEEVVKRIGSDPLRWSVEDFEAVARWTMKSDAQGFARTMKLLKDAVWYAPGWSLRDIRAFVAGMRYSLERLLPEIVRNDAWEHGMDFEIPFFIFQGEADVLTTPGLAKAYFDGVTAPLKRFALIADAGHFAAFLQPERFLQLLLTDVLPLCDETHTDRASMPGR